MTIDFKDVFTSSFCGEYAITFLLNIAPHLTATLKSLT